MLKDARAVYTPGISERASGTSKFYHGDALGSTRGITNGSQTVTDAVLYDAFGMTVSRTGSTATPFGFVGAAQYQSDADSGLQLLGHRMYDPSVGRFISSDPAKAGTNWFAYCQNGPESFTDAAGLDGYYSPVEIEALHRQIDPAVGRGAAATGGFIATVIKVLIWNFTPVTPGDDMGTEPLPPSRRGPVKNAGLPLEGKVRYIPSEKWQPTTPLPRGPSKGYMDKFGNEWVKGPPHHFPNDPFEWDVQLPNGGHWNVSGGGIAR